MHDQNRASVVKTRPQVLRTNIGHSTTKAVPNGALSARASYAGNLATMAQELSSDSNQVATRASNQQLYIGIGPRARPQECTLNKF